MKRGVAALLVVLAVAGCGDSGSQPSADARNDAASDPDGPALRVTPAQFESAFACSGPLDGIARDAVLLTPAFTSADESFGFNYAREFRRLGIPYCMLSFEDRGFGDLRVSAEYVVMAVRRMSRESGRKVILFGHQHGPLVEMWALKFWPDLAAKVSSHVSLATPYQGTVAARQLCDIGRRCPPSVWQIAAGSRFLAALNAAPLPAGPAYLSISTNFDEVIVPQPEASRLSGASARQIVLQQVCPGRLVEHFSILIDALTYQLVLMAIDRPGVLPDPATLPAGVCGGSPVMPGIVDPASAVAALRGFGGFLVGFAVAVPVEGVDQEP